MANQVPIVGDGNGRVSKAQATRVVTFLASLAVLAGVLGFDIDWLDKLSEKPAELIVVVGGVITAVQSAIGYFERLNRRKEVIDVVKEQETKRQSELRQRLTDLVSRK